MIRHAAVLIILLLLPPLLSAIARDVIDVPALKAVLLLRYCETGRGNWRASWFRRNIDVELFLNVGKARASVWELGSQGLRCMECIELWAGWSDTAGEI